MAHEIFISYRREDTRHAALALGSPRNSGEHIEARRELAALVRLHVPLSAVLLARAADAPPGGAPA